MLSFFAGKGLSILASFALPVHRQPVSAHLGQRMRRRREDTDPKSWRIKAEAAPGEDGEKAPGDKAAEDQSFIIN